MLPLTFYVSLSYVGGGGGKGYALYPRKQNLDNLINFKFVTRVYWNKIIKNAKFQIISTPIQLDILRHP